MLYPDHIEQRFNKAPVATRVRAACAIERRQACEQGGLMPSTARDAFYLVASVAGNMLLGSLLLGSLLMAPLWLHGLLLPLL